MHVIVAIDKLPVVEGRTGMVNEYMQGKAKIETRRPNSKEYYNIHEALIQIHVSLTNGVSEFVEDLGVGCERGLEVVNGVAKWPESTSQPLQKDAEATPTVGTSKGFLWRKGIFEEVLRSHLHHWRLTAKVLLEQRDQQLTRVDMQLRVVRYHVSIQTHVSFPLSRTKTSLDGNYSTNIGNSDQSFTTSCNNASLWKQSTIIPR